MTKASGDQPDISLTAETADRAVGALLGLAVGDALGTTLEFKKRDSYPLHTEMIGGGPFNLKPGQWTDDTAMALALADGLNHCTGFDAHDVITRFVAWWHDGAYSCTGDCFDIGRTTVQALRRFQLTGNPFAGDADPHTAGNGSIMRLAPVALYALHDANDADRIARGQSRTTHAAPAAADACALFVQILRDAILGHSDPLRPRSFTGHPEISAIAAGSYRGKTRDQIRSSGYVVDTLEAALWSVSQTTTFKDSVILAVNLGDDADTVGAVAGQLAGAIFGAKAIPKEWTQALAWRDRIMAAAGALIQF